MVRIPDEGELRVPVRLKASADELPDDEDEPVVNKMFVIRRRVASA